ncbi:MAG TPA: hypothetical protein RMH99_10170 [Sandaracinaceae bacterium LLY-WYZ-13_1]|nr:hypothetical protein [Sandaracinaceae bacterium LLY-WYZ-13_1]
MDTVQRHAEPYIPTRTERWPRSWKMGFGLIAFIPPVLLGLALLALVVDMVGAGLGNALPILFYVHVGAQFITLLLFGHLMVSNERLTGPARAIWAAAFLFLAPVAIPLYWWIHVVRERESAHPSASVETSRTATVHVHDYDYTSSGPDEDHRRPDGSVVHEHPQGA